MRSKSVPLVNWECTLYILLADLEQLRRQIHSTEQLTLLREKRWIRPEVASAPRVRRAWRTTRPRLRAARVRSFSPHAPVNCREESRTSEAIMNGASQRQLAPLLLAESDDSSSSSQSTSEDSSDEEDSVCKQVFDVMFRPPEKKAKIARESCALVLCERKKY